MYCYWSNLWVKFLIQDIVKTKFIVSQLRMNQVVFDRLLIFICLSLLSNFIPLNLQFICQSFYWRRLQSRRDNDETKTCSDPSGASEGPWCTLYWVLIRRVLEGSSGIGKYHHSKWFGELRVGSFIFCTFYLFIYFIFIYLFI